ncbi:hypothetical protein [Leifsonia sp. ZF2019]|nr:hypothetical protein [Leifsonia sp. ZF2019]
MELLIGLRVEPSSSGAVKRQPKGRVGLVSVVIVSAPEIVQ